MTFYEIISVVLASISSLVAILSFIFSFKTKKKYDSFMKSQLKIDKNAGVAVGVNNGEVNVKQK
jgi:hypothetical protein